MQAQINVPELLRGHPLFAGFDAAVFATLAGTAQLLTLEPGRMLFQRGDRALAFFMVAEGQIKLFLQSRSGDEKIIELENPGQCFAEAIMFMRGAAYPVSAVATETSAVVSIPARKYRQALEQDTETCLRMLGVLSQRLHAKVQEIEELTLEKAEHRLALNLLRRASPDADGRMRVHLDETRQMLASQLAIKPETLSRLIRSFCDAGLIETDGRDIIICDARGLRREDN